jgi:Zn-dependent protease
MPTQQGAFRIFRIAGITVFLHWTWFVVAAWEIDSGIARYSSPVWDAVQYVSLFLIVLLHEFGHALATRQVGGRAEQIVLWPLGGVAYVAPPYRPGAQLWSIAAGPLVNVALIPVFYLLKEYARAELWMVTMPDAFRLVRALEQINLGLLIFNLLPIYPLDGGQIVRSLLWFGVGPIRSLQAATVIGFVGVAWLVIYAIERESILLGVLTAFIFMNCLAGWREARALQQHSAGTGWR